jgi:hypothetical protein
VIAQLPGSLREPVIRPEDAGVPAQHLVEKPSGRKKLAEPDQGMGQKVLVASRYYILKHVTGSRTLAKFVKGGG